MLSSIASKPGAFDYTAQVQAAVQLRFVAIILLQSRCEIPLQGGWSISTAALLHAEEPSAVRGWSPLVH